MARPGFVLEVDRSTPPIMFWRGENFSLEKLPAGRSRVIYPPEPLAPLEDIDGAIRNPGRSEPADKPDSMLDPDAIAATYWNVAQQPRSAWTWEVELRPWLENF